VAIHLAAGRSVHGRSRGRSPASQETRDGVSETVHLSIQLVRAAALPRARGSLLLASALARDPAIKRLNWRYIAVSLIDPDFWRTNGASLC